VLCTDARCGGRTGHILHGVNHHLGPVHQPPSSLALDRDPVGPPDGECGERGCGPTPPRVHRKLGVKRESRAAACARCAARGACVRGTLAARPLCGSYSSCRRLSSTYDSWQRIYVCTKGIRSKNGGLPLMVTVILLSSIRAGPLLKSCRYARRSLFVVHATEISQYTMPC
jgi:hypothetical protein